jgi:hypothetical protein
MGSSIPWKQFQAYFIRYGVTFRAPKGGGSHWKMFRKIGSKSRIYVIPLEHGKQVRDVYLQKARKALGLTEQNGVSDAEFSDVK